MSVHYTEKYLLNPGHKVTVHLVGIGGTGSSVLSFLARTSGTLKALGHPGLHVRAWDPDVVTAANMNRQLFYEPDLGLNKAIVSVTRINRAFGIDWEANPEFYDPRKSANIVITCIDTAAGRVEIGRRMLKVKGGEPTERSYYWMDMGNTQKTGQVILGTVIPIAQPKSDAVVRTTLPDVLTKFPQIKKMKDKDQGPSCSMMEAIGKQDLFINPAMALYGGDLIWKLFRQGVLRHHGHFVNLESGLATPMRIK